MQGNEKCIVPAICKLIQHAKQNEWPVIVVEFTACGETNASIVEALSGYTHKETVSKSIGDGGPEIIKCIEKHQTWSLDLLVCVLYGNECVSDTVAGLFETSDLVEVDVVTDAVYPDYCSSSEVDEHGQQREREVLVADICHCKSNV
jgi:hypothetical protein